MNLPLEEQSIIRVCFDSAVTILTGGGHQVSLEAEIELLTPGNGAVVLEPDSPGPAALHIIRLVGDTMSTARTEGDGSLRIVFESGVELTAPPDTHYESWSVVGPSGGRAVCMPGGEIAVWDGL
ncbi:DUF6188 family protein [Nocardiopsis sp. CNT-189]|uniref:DUF6188 family protein n=1 Tax=Nocardiopsis oceanisediminis TaxID=2816862 RepID=UPI003B3B7D9C